jgi:hypothetical protein
MNQIEDYERLAKLAGLPNLDDVNDPERLERLVAAAESLLAHCTLQCPLRYQVAYRHWGKGRDASPIRKRLLGVREAEAKGRSGGQ